jgi:hypothetical protein
MLTAFAGSSVGGEIARARFTVASLARTGYGRMTPG